MAVVRLKLPHHAYDIRIEPGALGRVGPWLAEVAPDRRAAMFVDRAIAETHGRVVADSVASAGYDLVKHEAEGGEPWKDLDTVRRLYQVLLDAHVERKSPVLAVGGGVIGDTVGFAAATYLRGLPLVQCPTTLLSMVDASVGGKVAVNVPAGKNLVGSFYQPRLVVIDTDTLKTLPPRELRCGLAECVKHALIRDAELFDWTEDHLDDIVAGDEATMIELLERNVQIKADVVMADEKESGVRAHLNFGHTFAHAIEATQQYGGYLHGEAVSLGMVAAARLAADSGRCDSEVPDRLEALLGRIGLPVRSGDLPPDDVLIEVMAVDKKVAGGRLRFVLPTRIGHVTITDEVEVEQVKAAWAAVRQ